MKRCKSRSLVAWALASASLLVGCHNYSHQLQRGQGYYERNQYEMALAVWRNLESDQDSLDQAELVRYCYLRGMTDFRLGYRADARYWLGLSKASQSKAQTALQQDEKNRLERTLAELDREVFGDDAPGTVAQDLGDSCQWTSDCERGFICKESTCVAIEEELRPDPKEGSEPEPKGGAETESTESAPASDSEPATPNP